MVIHKYFNIGLFDNDDYVSGDDMTWYVHINLCSGIDLIYASMQKRCERTLDAFAFVRSHNMSSLGINSDSFLVIFVIDSVTFQLNSNTLS